MYYTEYMPNRQELFDNLRIELRSGCVIVAALITARPDATLAELRDALPTTAALSTLWRTIGRLQFTVKKNGPRRRTTPA